MTGFNPEDFLYQETEQELDTKFIPVPQGDYEAQAVSVTAKGGETDKTESGRWTSLQISWEVNDPTVKEVTTRDTNRVTQNVFLDLTPDGKLDQGPQRNITLGQIYKACGLPVKGSSPKQIEGQVAKIRVKHSAIPNSDDGEGNPVVRAEVSSVRPL